jgi:hypothetical protein
MPFAGGAVLLVLPILSVMIVVELFVVELLVEVVVEIFALSLCSTSVSSCVSFSEACA